MQGSIEYKHVGYEEQHAGGGGGAVVLIAASVVYGLLLLQNSTKRKSERLSKLRAAFLFVRYFEQAHNPSLSDYPFAHFFSMRVISCHIEKNRNPS